MDKVFEPELIEKRLTPEPASQTAGQGSPDAKVLPVAA